MNPTNEYRSGRNLRFLAAAGLLSLTSGCNLFQSADTAPPTRLELPGVVDAGVDAPVSKTAIADMRRTEAIARVEELLREEGFWIEVIDRRFGRLRTLPAPVPVAGEFWAGPEATGSEQATATLSAMRRIALVEITETDRSAVVSIEVRHQRLRAAHRRISGSFSRRVFYDTRVDGILGPSNVTDTVSAGLGDPRDERLMWIPAGRDLGLEQRLLDKLQTPAG